MIRILTACLALLMSFAAMAGEPSPTVATPRPLAILVVTDPWAMVVGADNPWFALYDDGQVIYRERTAEGRYRYMAARLDPAELAGVEAKLVAFAADPVPDRLDLRSGWTDQPQSGFFVDVDGHRLVTSVDGLGASIPDAAARDRGDENADVLPANLAGLHAYLTGFRAAAAQPWVPERLEVMLWDYSYAPDASIQWPADWPGLDHPTTLQRGESYSIFLPGTQQAELMAFLATRNQKGAVELAGRKWAASWRPVFPPWIDAFRTP